jgi:hypothetical protein
MAVVEGNVDQVRTGPGRILIGPYGTPLPEDFGVSGAAPALNAALVEIGFTTEGSELSVTQESTGVEVAERIRAIRYENTSSEASYSFTMAQISPLHLQLALGGGTITTTPNGAEKFTFPKVGGGLRFSIVWESEDGKEYLVIAKASSSGTITIPRKKSPDVAGIPVEFRIEENDDETILSGEDMIYLPHPDLTDI